MPPREHHILEMWDNSKILLPKRKIKKGRTGSKRHHSLIIDYFCFLSVFQTPYLHFVSQAPSSLSCCFHSKLSILSNEQTEEKHQIQKIFICKNVFYTGTAVWDLAKHYAFLLKTERKSSQIKKRTFSSWKQSCESRRQTFSSISGPRFS